MPKLVDLIDIIPGHGDDEPEDILACARDLVFPDDTRNIHGDPGDTIVYKSSRFGNIELTTADPKSERERQLFSHYLWNGSIKLAELISGDDPSWDIRGETVLELGAGVGLGGIVACLAKAREVVISDYPAPEVLHNIESNAKGAIPMALGTRYRIEGHEWGAVNTRFARANAHRFSRILAADCFWLASQHANLARSMAHFLTIEPEGRVLAILAFHTGRGMLSSFFETASHFGLIVDDIYEEDADGVRREWLNERDGGHEDRTGRKRWLVVARLKRRHGDQ